MLYKRYGFAFPGFKNQMSGFASVVIYQLSVLQYLSLFTQVNLNFVLCHSPADPFFPHINYHYFTAGVVVLNIISLMARWLSYLVVLPFKLFYDS